MYYTIYTLILIFYYHYQIELLSSSRMIHYLRQLFEISLPQYHKLGYLINKQYIQ